MNSSCWRAGGGMAGYGVSRFLEQLCLAMALGELIPLSCCVCRGAQLHLCAAQGPREKSSAGCLAQICSRNVCARGKQDSGWQCKPGVNWVLPLLVPGSAHLGETSPPLRMLSDFANACFIRLRCPGNQVQSELCLVIHPRSCISIREAPSCCVASANTISSSARVL